MCPLLWTWVAKKMVDYEIVRIIYVRFFLYARGK